MAENHGPSVKDGKQYEGLREGAEEAARCGSGRIAHAVAMTDSRHPLPGSPLTDATSAAMVELYSANHGHERTTGTTYINDNVVACILEDILSVEKETKVAHGRSGEVIDGRVAFKEDTEDEFTEAVERRAGRKVTAFLSANQTAPGIACELFFLDGAPAGSPRE